MAYYVIKYHTEEGRVYQTDFLKSVDSFIERCTYLSMNKPHLVLTKYIVINGNYIELDI